MQTHTCIQTLAGGRQTQASQMASAVTLCYSLFSNKQQCSHWILTSIQQMFLFQVIRESTCKTLPLHCLLCIPLWKTTGLGWVTALKVVLAHDQIQHDLMWVSWTDFIGASHGLWFDKRTMDQTTDLTVSPRWIGYYSIFDIGYILHVSLYLHFINTANMQK